MACQLNTSCEAGVHRLYCMAGIVKKGAEVPCPVDADGRFTSEVADFAGR